MVTMLGESLCILYGIVGMRYVQRLETVRAVRFFSFFKEILFSHFMRSTFNCNEMKKKLFRSIDDCILMVNAQHNKNRIVCKSWLILYFYICARIYVCRIAIDCG